jgi:hypothetical protein
MWSVGQSSASGRLAARGAANLPAPLHFFTREQPEKKGVVFQISTRKPTRLTTQTIQPGETVVEHPRWRIFAFSGKNIERLADGHQRSFA